MVEEGEKCSTISEPDFPTFSSFQKIDSRTSFITHTTMIIYSNISLQKGNKKVGYADKPLSENNCY